MTAKVRAHIFVTGRVQGVYYRQNTMETAEAHGVTGWVRNLPDGRVEAVLEGDEVSVKKVIEWCKVGPPRAEVEKVDTKFESYAGNISEFTISY
ncbi:MAG: acylphosphatase [Nitrososphaera sp.]